MAYNKSADGSSMKRRPMRRRKKVCVFCGKDNVIDYKDTNKLKRYISERGKIPTTGWWSGFFRLKMFYV